MTDAEYGALFGRAEKEQVARNELETAQVRLFYADRELERVREQLKWTEGMWNSKTEAYDRQVEWTERTWAGLFREMWALTIIAVVCFWLSGTAMVYGNSILTDYMVQLIGILASIGLVWGSYGLRERR